MSDCFCTGTRGNTLSAMNWDLSCMYATETLVSGTFTWRSLWVGLGIGQLLSERQENVDELASVRGSGQGLTDHRAGPGLRGLTVGGHLDRVASGDRHIADHLRDAGDGDGGRLAGSLGLVLEDTDHSTSGSGQTALVHSGDLHEVVLLPTVGIRRPGLTRNTRVDAHGRISVQRDRP